MFETLGMTGKPNLNFLEIGCFEGRTTRWLLENVLTDQTSRITVIDTFKGSPEFESLGIDSDFHERFEKNIADYKDKVDIRYGRSDNVLIHLLDGLHPKSAKSKFHSPQFDFIYVDGSHMAADVLSDAVLSWPLLKLGGVMCFDDLHWGEENLQKWERPQIAIEAFVSCYASQLRGAPQGHDQYVAIKNILN